jgi:D-amino peptidase
VKLPTHFKVEVKYKDHAKAYGMSFFPGAHAVDDHTILFEADDYFDVLRFFMFIF